MRFDNFLWNFHRHFHLCFKRKTRGSNSPTSETISPKTKRLKESVKEHQANAPPAIVSLPKKKNDSEDVVLSALNMAEDFASKVDLILSKLSQLENIGTQIKILQDSVDRMNQMVANLQSDFYRLKDDVRNTVEETSAIKTSIKFLNDEVEISKRKLQDDEERSQQEMDHFRLQLLNYEVYSRRENLRFYGISETDSRLKFKVLGNTVSLITWLLFSFQLGLVLLFDYLMSHCKCTSLSKGCYDRL